MKCQCDIAKILCQFAFRRYIIYIRYHLFILASLLLVSDGFTFEFPAVIIHADTWQRWGPLLCRYYTFAEDGSFYANITADSSTWHSRWSLPLHLLR